MEFVSSLIIPCVILLAAILMCAKKRVGMDAFTDGAKVGMKTAVGLLPTMLLLTVGLSMLSASGALELLAKWLEPVGNAIGIPVELLPLILARPVSGSASTAAYAQLLEQYGADSFPALCASVLMGSSDTIIYVIAVYFSGTALNCPGVRKIRHTAAVAVAVMLLCIFLSCALCRMLWG